MIGLWQRAWIELTSGLSDDAHELLRSLRIRKDVVCSSGELSRFSAKSSQHGRPRIVLRVEATRVRWRHAGLRIAHKSCVLEANGVPIARVKLKTTRSHKKGGRFEGAKNFSLLFDHEGAVKGEALLSGALTKDAIEAPPASGTLMIAAIPLAAARHG